MSSTRTVSGLLVALALALPATAGAATLGEVATVSEPRDHITDLFLDGGAPAWAYRDGGQEGAGMAGEFEYAIERGVRPSPVGLAYLFQRGRKLSVDLNPGVLPVTTARARIDHAQLATGDFEGLDVVWQEGDRRVYAARRPRRRFAKPKLLGTGRIGDVAAASVVSVQGLVVAWQEGDRIKVRVRKSGRGRFGRVQTIAGARVANARLHVSQGLGTHTLHVAWTSDTGRVQVASTQRDGFRFGRALTLDTLDAPRGLAAHQNVVAWATRKAVKVVDLKRDQVDNLVVTKVRGAHVDDVDSTGVIGYTVAGHAEVAPAAGSRLDLGSGHAVRFDDSSNGVYWVAPDGGREIVRRGTIFGETDECNPIRFGRQNCERFNDR